MTQNRRDAAPESAGRKRAVEGTAASEPVSAAQVADYLRRHMDFFGQNPDLLEEMQPLARDCGAGVVDLQQYIVEHLRAELTGLAAARDALVVTGRNNLSAQARVHKATLALLAAKSFEHFIETLTTDLAVILDLDVVTIGVEQNGPDSARAQTAGVFRLEQGTVDRLIGPDQAIALRETVEGDPAVFGPGAGLIASDALL
ncbi:MAG: DUF484 family protein, partial [Proteobacteria bacterium]|nr:DUF484 family protein [Pseudomonadota bacterium]